MISRSDWEPLPIKASEFLRIPAKNRNGTEGTEILGNPLPVTGIPKVARFLPTTRPTRGTARTRRGSRAPRLF